MLKIIFHKHNEKTHAAGLFTQWALTDKALPGDKQQFTVSLNQMALLCLWSEAYLVPNGMCSLPSAVKSYHKHNYQRNVKHEEQFMTTLLAKR